MFVKGQEVWFHWDDMDLKKTIGKSTIASVFKDNIYQITGIGNIPKEHLFISRERAVMAATLRLKQQHEKLVVLINTHYFDVKKAMVKVVRN